MLSSNTDQYRTSARWLLVSLVLAAGVFACDEQSGVAEQRVPKGVEPPPRAWTDAPASSRESQTAVDASGWVVPEGWRRSEEERPMRLATYEAPAADGWVEVAVTRFPGRVGGELANINRWRGQMGLPPIHEADLPDALERFTCPAGPGYVARLEGDESHMLAIAVYESAAGRTWFVRATDVETRIDAIEPAARRLACSLPASDTGAPR